jgi:hypothetical protein
LKQDVLRRLIGEAEHFWQKRHYDFNIRNHRQFVEKLRYVQRNPVERGLCERPEDWEWSSFRQYATGCDGRVETECEWTAGKRERSAGRVHPAIQAPHSSPNSGLNGPPAEGSTDFMRQQMSLLPEWGNSMEHTNEVVVPKGTTVYVGPAASVSPLTGGGIQVWVTNP